MKLSNPSLCLKFFRRKCLIKALNFVLVFSLLLISSYCRRTSDHSVKYGITPYQDSALPVVADYLGWYEENNIEFELVPLAWGDVITALISGAIDVAIYNFNSFQAPYENAAIGTNKPIYYCPTYIFKGQAIMVHNDAGLDVFKDRENETPQERKARLKNVILQLKDKKIAVTEGTELEQIVLEALKIANLDPNNDVSIIHASPEDGLAAFLSKDIDAFAAGLTERTEARRHNAIELLVTSDVTLPVIDGIVTTEEFASKNQELLDKLVVLWFQTIRYMEEDLSENSKHIRDYLAKSASTRYSVEEYKIAWSFNIFPQNPKAACELFCEADSPYYWKISWDENNKFLLESKKIKSPIPYSAFIGEKVLNRLVDE